MGWSRLLARALGEGENPVRWGPTLGRVAGVRVRVHVVLIAWIALVLIASLPHDALGIVPTLLGVLALLMVLVVREFARIGATRALGGEADESLLWPLGSVAGGREFPSWRHEAMAAGAPTLAGVLVALLALAGLLVAGAPRDAVLLNPLHPARALAALRTPGGTQPVWLLGVWWTYAGGMIVTLLNLAPMMPLDAARIARAYLSRVPGGMGRHGATRVTAIAGIVSGLGMVALGSLVEQATLVGVGVLGALACVQELRQLRFVEDPVSPDAGEFAASLHGSGPDARAEREADRRAEKAEAREQSERAEVDRVLAKISASGMDSLTRSERRTLERETARKRSGPA
jgi:Zn-dependent protease